MACKYFDGKNWVTESEFKSLLNRGLLDQLMSVHEFNVEGFEVNEDYIQNISKEVKIEPVSLRLRRKVNKLHNNYRKVVKPKEGELMSGNKLEIPKKNPLDLIKEANSQMATHSEKSGIKRSPIDLVLVTKVGGEIQGVSGIPSAKKAINKAFVDFKDTLTEGAMYMMVPSSNGFTPVRLFNSFLGQTTDAKKVKSLIENVSNLNTPIAERKKIAEEIQEYLYKVKITPHKNGVEVVADTREGMNNPLNFTTNEQLSEYILGKYDSNGNYNGELDNEGKPLHGGRLARVDFNKINIGKNNEEYANKKYLTTDMYSEDGNFFNSSSFIMSTFKAESKSEQELEEVLNDPNILSPKIEVEDNSESDRIVSKNIQNQDTKEEESSINNEPIKEVKKVKDSAPEPAPGDDTALNDLMAQQFAKEKDSIDKSKGKSLDDIGDPNKGESFNIEDGKAKIVDSQEEQVEKIDLEKEKQWIREKIGTKGLGFDSFKTIEDLRKYLPEDVYDQLLHARKQGKQLHGLYQKAAFFLNENAYSGTGYHEAFHVVFSLSLPLGQRIDILNDAAELFQDELGKNPTFIQTEELLADKFMEYIQAKEQVTYNLKNKVGRYFKALYRKLKLFFNKNAKISINELFENIELGVYKNNRPNFKNTDLTKISPDLIKFRQEYGFENLYDEKASIEYLNYKFFQKIDEYKNSNPGYEGMSDSKIIQKIGIQKLYSELLNQVLSDRALANKENKEWLTPLLDETVNAITNQQDADYFDIVEIKGKDYVTLKKSSKFLQKFNRGLRVYGINISLDKVNDSVYDIDPESSLNEINENEESDNYVERWQQAYIEINPVESISQVVKRKIARIPKTTLVDNKPMPAKNKMGVPIYYDAKEVFGFLGRNLTDTYSYSDMVSKLEELKKEKPFVSHIYSLLNEDPSFGIQLFTTLASKTFQNFLTVYEVNGEYRIFYSNRQTIDNVIKENLLSNFLSKDNKHFNKFTKGPQKGEKNFESINEKEVKETRKNIKELQKEIEDSRSKEIVNPLIKKISNFFTENNIPLSENQILDIWNTGGENMKVNYDNLKRLLESADNNIFKKLEEGNNPFLNMVPEETIVSENKTISRSFIENFARTIKPAMEKETIIAFRNADNKTVYSIQLSNFLNKSLSKLTDETKLKERIENVKKDPLISSLPILKDLEENPNYRDNLEVVTFDGLSRKGKSRSVDYSSLGDIEMVSAELAMFYNNGNKNYAYYRMPTPSDNGVAPMIKQQKLSKEEVLDKLTTVAQGEINRIDKVKNLAPDSKLRRIPNYIERGSKFIHFSFLENIIDPNNYTIEELREAIENHLNTSFLEQHKKAYQNVGVIDNFEKGTKGRISFAPKLITSQIKANEREDFFTDYLWNSFYANIINATIFAGDPAFYKNTTDFQKRYKQIISPGTFTTTSEVTQYTGLIFNDEEVPSNKELVDDIVDLIKKSTTLTQNKKKELINDWVSRSKTREEKGNPNNHTDAATFISVDRMEDLYYSLDRMTPEHEEALERIREGKEHLEDAAMFRVEKPFMYTIKNIEGIEVPVQIKNSEIMLTKSFAERKDNNGNLKYPKLAKIYKILNEGFTKKIITKDSPEGEIVDMPPADFIAFESAVKVGAVGNRIGNEGIEFSKLNKVGEEFILDDDVEIMTLNQEDWRLQQEVPNHYIDDTSNFGTQARVLAIADLNPDVSYLVDGKKFKSNELVNLYNDLIEENLKEAYQEIEEKFLDNGGDIDYSKLVKYIRKEAIDRNLNEEFLSALELETDPITGKQKTVVPLWHPSISYKVESLLNSLFKNGVTNQKINGGTLVNATSYGVDHTLKMSMKKGKYQMEALLPIWTKKFFPRKNNGEVDLENTPKELLEVIGYRIPTEDKYSIFNIKVVGFTDSAAGGHIILPVEATTIAGLDFDIDKLFMMFPQYKINSEGKAEVIKLIDNKTSTKEIASTIFNDNKALNKLFKDTGNEEIGKEWLDKKRAYKQAISDAYNKRKLLELDEDTKDLLEQREKLVLTNKYETDPEAVLINQNSIDEIDQQLESDINYDEITEEIKELKEDYKNLEKNFEDLVIKKLKGVDYSKYNSKAARDNMILEIMKGILSNPHTAESILDVGSFDSLKDSSKKTRLLQIDTTVEENKKIYNKAKSLFKKQKSGKIELKEYRDQLDNLIDELENVDYNLSYPSTQLDIYKNNMTGKQLIGIFANHNSNHAKAQHTNLRLNNTLEFLGKEYQSLSNIYNKSGERISKDLATYLAAVVDNAKDPIAAHLNINNYTANATGLLARLGVNREEIAAFMNQPVILEATREYLNNKNSIEKQKKQIKNIKTKLKQRLITETDFKGINFNEELAKRNSNFQLEELENMLNSSENRTNIDYYFNQFKILEKFEEIQYIANSLNKVIQATRVDTKGVGPTSADNFTLLRKQSEVIEDINNDVSPIVGVYDLLYGRDGHRINANFQQYGWQKPVSIFNKIFPSIGTLNGIGEMSYSTLGKIKNFFADLKQGEEFSINEREVRLIENDFMTFLLSAHPFFNRKNGEEQLRVMQETPNKVLEFTKNNPNSEYNIFLNQLAIKSADKTIPFRRIQFYNTGKTSLDTENATLVWSQMMEDGNLETKKLAFDLVKYAYFTSGFSMGPMSFFNLIPIKFWTNDFGKDPNNKGMLLDSRDRTFNQIFEAGIDMVANEEIDANTVRKFMIQFLQNNGIDSTIFPELENSVETSERKHSPVQIKSLNKNQVFVFPTNLEGAHNTGFGRYAFEKQMSETNEPKVVGERGNWAVYGKTAEIQIGNLGKGFGIRTEPVSIANGKIKRINAKDQKGKFISIMKQDLAKLGKTAASNSNLEFIMAHKLNNIVGISTYEIKGIFIELMKDGLLPNNIILPQEYDPRDYNKKEYNSKTKRLTFNKRGNEHLKIKNSFPAFIKMNIKKQTKLFFVNKTSLESSYEKVEYIEVPKSGHKNFGKEYDITNHVEESVIDKLSKASPKKLVDFKSLEEHYLEAFQKGYVANQEVADSTSLEDLDKQSEDPLQAVSENLESPTSPKKVDPLHSSPENINLSQSASQEHNVSSKPNTSYENYRNLVNKIDSEEEIISKEAWENLNEDIKIQMISQLEIC